MQKDESNEKMSNIAGQPKLFECPLLTVQFNLTLRPHELDYFRQAIIEIAGREHTLFHNHLSQTTYRYGYPLIQYRWVQGKPAIVCLREGCEELLHFFQHCGRTLRIKSEYREFSIHKVTFRRWQFFIAPYLQFHYRLASWLALNETNYQTFKQLKRQLHATSPTHYPHELLAFLERILIGNILSMAKGIGWTISEPIQVRITRIIREKTVWFKKKIPLIAFDILWKSNVRLPSYIGLGKGVSRGYGSLSRITTNNPITSHAHHTEQ